MSQTLEQSLPKTVTLCHLGDREIYLVGTAHVSKASVEDVRQTIQQIQPDSVCIELCPARHEAMMDPDRWKKMDILQIIRKGKAAFLLGQLILSSFYQRIADKLGVEPGAEMREGIVQAQQIDAELVMADRSVEVTLKRVWRHLSLLNRMKMLFQLLQSLVTEEDLGDTDIDHLREQGNVEGVMETFAEHFPQIKERLIDERDIYLAQKIRASSGRRVVAVVGAGHVAGIQEHLVEERCIRSLDEVPPSSKWGTVLKWVIPLIIVLLPFLGFLGQGSAKPVESLWVWALSHSILAGIGAAAAFAHPMAILGTGISAPFTSLNPMIAAGWVGGMLQLYLKRPTVADLEDLPNAITSARGFWRNPVTRVLLVVALGNLGSTLGTVLSGAWIFSHFV